MPSGMHRISASRGGAPVSFEITVDASTAETLNAFRQAQLTKAADGSDDPQSGGVCGEVVWNELTSDKLSYELWRH
jgi:hypothetical protein